MKLLIAIITCAKNVALKQLARSTWIPFAEAFGYDVKFFSSAFCGCSDDYQSVLPKTYVIQEYAKVNGYSNLLRITDDTYIRIDRLRDFGKPYGGHIWPACDFGCARYEIPDAPAGTYPYNYVSGGAVWMNRDAIEVMSGKRSEKDWSDDRWTGDVLAKAGIQYTALPEFYLNHQANEGVCTCEKDKPGPYVAYLDAGERIPALHQEMLNERR
jgi:hypothetical protein